MTNNYHDVVTDDTQANPEELNARLGGLDAGITETAQAIEDINFEYSGESTEFLNGEGEFTVPVGTGSSIDGHVIQDEGVDLPQRAKLNIQGDLVQASNGVSATEIDVNLQNDTSPQLGGDLDLNGHKIYDPANNVVIKLPDNLGDYGLIIIDADDNQVASIKSDGVIKTVDHAGYPVKVGEGALNFLMQARLTPTSGVPVELDENLAVETIYWTPFQGAAVSLFSENAWRKYYLTEQSLKLKDTSQTGTTSNGNAVITDLTDTSLLFVGMEVSGDGIPASTTIASIDSETQVTLSGNCSADSSGVSITFATPANSKLDLFGEVSGGEAVFRRPVLWTDLSTRSAALAKQDGHNVLSGESTAVYLGWVRTGDTPGQLKYTLGRQSIYNHYHQSPRNVAHWEEHWITAPEFEPPTADGCSDVVFIDDSPCRAFDPDAIEYCTKEIKFPTGWSGVFRARIHAKVADALSGNFFWRVRTRIGRSGAVYDVYVYSTIDIDGAPGAAFKLTQSDLSADIDLSGEDSDTIQFSIYRYSTDPGFDNYTSDVYFVGVELYGLMNGDTD